MLTVSDSSVPISCLVSDTVVTGGGGGGGLAFDLDFGFVPVEDLPETAAATRDDAGVLTGKDDEESWLKDKKRCRFEVIRAKGY